MGNKEAPKRSKVETAEEFATRLFDLAHEHRSDEMPDHIKRRDAAIRKESYAEGVRAAAREARNWRNMGGKAEEAILSLLPAPEKGGKAT